MSQKLGCPKCGATLTLDPPDDLHIQASTEKPDSHEFIERPVKCPDPNTHESRRMPHTITIYWYGRNT